MNRTDDHARTASAVTGSAPPAEPDRRAETAPRGRTEARERDHRSDPRRCAAAVSLSADRAHANRPSPFPLPAAVPARRGVRSRLVRYLLRSTADALKD